MSWVVVQENQRKYADESYYLKALLECPEGNLVLEVAWAEIMYAVTVDLVSSSQEPQLLYGCMVFYQDRVEKYAHQIMKITQKHPMASLKRLDGFQKDSVINHNLSERFGVRYTSRLPEKVNKLEAL